MRIHIYISIFNISARCLLASCSQKFTRREFAPEFRRPSPPLSRDPQPAPSPPFQC